MSNMKRKPFTRTIADSHYFRNATVTLDEEGSEMDGKYRGIVSYERYSGAVWTPCFESDNFYDRNAAIQYCKDAVRQLSA